MLMRLSDHRAAIFDLDGTLVHSEPAWEEAKGRVLVRLGIQIPQSVYDGFVGRGLRGFLTEVLGPDLSHSRRTILANEIGAEADILLPKMRLTVPGAADFVKCVVRSGLSVAVCSSSPPRHILAALDQLGVADIIPTVISGADLRRGKPDPMPYLATLRRLTLSPDQAFAVEDALPGVRSAHAAGLAVIGIGAEAQKAEFAAFCRFRVMNYQELDRLFHA